MATYAAYRHVELDNVGYGKKRVLKPPGGGSSDIFGVGPEETSPRRVKNYNQSQLGTTMFGETNAAVMTNGGSETPRAKPGNDSYKRLFGPPDAPPTPNSKNHMRSNISLSGDPAVVTTSPTKSNLSSNGSTYGNGNSEHSDTGGSSCMPRNPVTGDGVDVTPLRRSARKSRDGNPVTGTGYTGDTQNGVPTMNGNANIASEKASSTASAAAAPSSGTAAPAAQPRTRVPPGGFSSGLW